jgi:hypothetical protein
MWKERQTIKLEEIYKHKTYNYRKRLMAGVDHMNNIAIWTWTNSPTIPFVKLDNIKKLNPIEPSFNYWFDYNIGNILNLRFTNDGENLIIFGCLSHFIAIYNFANDTIEKPELGDFIEIFKRDTAHIKPYPEEGLRAVSHPTKNMLYLSFGKEDILVYDMDNHKVDREYKLTSPISKFEWIGDIVFSNEGTYYVCVFGDYRDRTSTIGLYNTDDNTLIKTLQTRRSINILIFSDFRRIKNISFSVDDTLVIIDCRQHSGVVMLWNIEEDDHKVLHDRLVMHDRKRIALLVVSPIENIFVSLADMHMLNFYQYSLLKPVAQNCLFYLNKSIIPSVKDIRTGMGDKLEIPTDIISKIMSEINNKPRVNHVQALKKESNEKYYTDNHALFFSDEKHIVKIINESVTIYEKS